MNTTRVAISVSQLKVRTAKLILEETGIKAFILDKRDSAYAGLFGNIELYVDKTEEERARAILEENGVFDGE